MSQARPVVGSDQSKPEQGPLRDGLSLIRVTAGASKDNGQEIRALNQDSGEPSYPPITTKLSDFNYVHGFGFYLVYKFTLCNRERAVKSS